MCYANLTHFFGELFQRDIWELKKLQTINVTIKNYMVLFPTIYRKSTNRKKYQYGTFS